MLPQDHPVTGWPVSLGGTQRQFHLAVDVMLRAKCNATSDSFTLRKGAQSSTCNAIPPWCRFRSRDLGCQIQTVEYQRPEIDGLWPVLYNKLEPTFVDDLRPARDTLETRSRSGPLQVLDLTRRLVRHHVSHRKGIYKISRWCEGSPQ